MECKECESNKLFKVFDASKRKGTRKKHDEVELMLSDDSTGGCKTVRRVSSAKASIQDISGSEHNLENKLKRNMDVSPTESRTRTSGSPRRHRRSTRDGVSLALKAGLVSTPRSISPSQEKSGNIESIPNDQDSFIYAFLEDAIKRDKKKHRHARHHDERRSSRDRNQSSSREHHHRRHRDETTDREKFKPIKAEPSAAPAMDQAALLETFAKLCSQLNDKSANCPASNVNRSHSHKSLQCEVATNHNSNDARQTQAPRQSSPMSHYLTAARSQENCHDRVRSRANVSIDQRSKAEKCVCCNTYDNDMTKYVSKMDMRRNDYHEYPVVNVPTRSCIDNNYRRSGQREYAEFCDRRDSRRLYEDEKRRYLEEKMSRSFDIHRDVYDEGRRTTRSDSLKEKNRRFDDKFYEDKAYARERHLIELARKERSSKRNIDRFERASIVSKDDHEERERDSGLSVADGDTSTISGKSNYLRVVKQEISEQREAMDKMMKLWKELMRCFKGISQDPKQDKAMHESAENVKESAVAQLRLWRECMQRYETVARDVGDTDARLMEEINKQRSEMAEMSTMWQECLQRYREMSNDFNSLKQKLATAESPTRHAPVVVCAEGEGTASHVPYRLPSNYHQAPPMPAGYPSGSPLRSRASAPPAWWWCENQQPPQRRRSSPESRGSRERDRRHRHKERERDDSRYKEKSKPSAARSEHRHRKR